MMPKGRPRWRRGQRRAPRRERGFGSGRNTQGLRDRFANQEVEKGHVGKQDRQRQAVAGPTGSRSRQSHKRPSSAELLAPMRQMTQTKGSFTEDDLAQQLTQRTQVPEMIDQVRSILTPANGGVAMKADKNHSRQHDAIFARSCKSS